jgi:hypothetical protein
MKFTTPLDELQHWLGMLEVDIRLGVQQRHLNSTARLCWVLLEGMRDDPPPVRVEEFRVLQIRLLDLQRAIDGNVKKPHKARPRLRVVQ